MRIPRVTASTLAFLVACAPTTRAPSSEPRVSTAGARDYLYLWTASADSTRPDYLAVVDITDEGERYGRIVATLPVPGLRNVPHHTEHEMPADGHLFANGFGAGRTWIFDVRNPAAPRIAGDFTDLEGYAHPHSYVRLPNGNVLATFQMRHGAGGVGPGGLVEITSAGKVVRSVSADAPGLDPRTRVYSAGIVPALDRIVTTTTDMDTDSEASRQVQIWRLSDLSLLRTIALPDGPAGGEGLLTAEPRLLADGRTVLVSTFACGLYLMEGLDTDQPSARLVASFPRKEETYCAIPVIAGNYYLVTVPAWSAVVSLDISDPARPREVSRLTLGADDVPHWIALSPDRRRVAVTGYGAMKNRVVMATFDSTTGALGLDERFGARDSTGSGLRIENGVPHGAVFSRRP
jgi:hypothetical protein